ncbi:class D sortase [Gracilibacillus sp. YIM 98692]|uniref:class D sortase n=1 Tax=Gracilibacillus sp. YIM 98692 TaxID=2663532 RepID=UPI0013D4DE6F|nr:class D sortase [Gracilibacillus sp. YIM 98692]
MKRSNKRKKLSKKQKTLLWIIFGVPSGIVILGVSIMLIFFWDLTKQTVQLTNTVVNPYKPSLEKKVFDNEEIWPTLPSPGENIGQLTISSLDLAYPVVQGTHENELEHGIGHFAGSMLPGQGGHVLLSGHRDTVFRKLEHLEIGDQMTFETPYGDFVYEATGFDIVPADDRTVAVPKDYESLTLTTCYPFDYIGDAPDRYVVHTELIEHIP